jgi:SAM-dependent methyltransferase
MATHLADSNRDSAQAWDGEEGDYWSQNADRYERVVGNLRARLLHRAAITDGEQVLDIGCGAGRTTREAAALTPTGGALGVDLSRRMLERAAERAAAAGISNARFEQADAQVHHFDEVFDVAISQFGSMFFGDPVAAFTNIGNALTPNGRLVLLSWQPMERSEWSLALRQSLAAGRPLPDTAPSGPGPYAHADPDVVRRILTGAGFVDVTVDGVEDTSWFGVDADDAFGFVRGMSVTRSMLVDLDEAARTRALDALRATLVAHQRADGVVFDSAAWLVTAQRGV